MTMFLSTPSLLAPAILPLAPPAGPPALARKRQEVLERLWNALSPADRAGVDRCAERLLGALEDRTHLAGNIVLVPYGGGKDSSYVLAFTRAAQLRIAHRLGETFTLRAATNYQSGMAVAVQDNMDRVYRALGLYHDPQAELLVIAGTRVLPFRPDLPVPADVIAADRLSILMNGHHTAGSNRATFCNACNLSMVRSFSLALCHGRPACLIITGDSEIEQRSYLRAVRHIAHDLDLPRRREGGFPGFLRLVDDIGSAYNQHVFGSASDGPQTQADDALVPAGVRFFSAFTDTHYDAGSHWDLLTRFLDFNFDDLAFSFSESDCANPALMAHLRGLKAEFLWGRSYAEGVAEYRDYGLALMQKKEFPEPLLERMRSRYADEAAITRMRRRVERYSEDVLGLTEENLVCMLFAPFTAQGHGLNLYLSEIQPHRRAAAGAIRELLAGQADSAALAAELTAWSGLALDSLRVLYRSPLSNNTGADTQFVGPIRVLFRHDPHQGRVPTRHSPTGPALVEIESGR
jgi:hypothetical protein